MANNLFLIPPFHIFNRNFFYRDFGVRIEKGLLLTEDLI